MHNPPPMPPAGKAILSGDLETMRRLANDGSLLFRKGKIVELRNNIPKTVDLDGKTITIYTDAFNFALENDQMEIVHLLIDRGLVDLGPNGDALFMAIRRRDFALADYLLNRGLQLCRDERYITRLLLSLMEKWDDRCPAFLDKVDLPIREMGGAALGHAADDGHIPLAAYLLSQGVDVNSRESTFQSTPVHRAAERGHEEIVHLLVDYGADITLRNELGLRPSTAAQANGHAGLAAWLRFLEPSGVVTEDSQDALFTRYRVPDAMRNYLKTGSLRLEFPQWERLSWIKLFAYLDVPEITYQGRQVLSLVEDSADYGVMLVWEPKSRKIWFVDMEHDVFHAVASWTRFIKNPGDYVNRAIRWEFDE